MVISHEEDDSTLILNMFKTLTFPTTLTKVLTWVLDLPRHNDTNKLRVDRITIDLSIDLMVFSLDKRTFVHERIEIATANQHDIHNRPNFIFIFLFFLSFVLFLILSRVLCFLHQEERPKSKTSPPPSRPKPKTDDVSLTPSLSLVPLVSSSPSNQGSKPKTNDVSLAPHGDSSAFSAETDDRNRG
uniref:Uncharacterized protein n=1 Tax=Brassica oleracea TaxID=3712 RepID=A0A3P6CR04_BRAOL|nr:unnamed protein product [Brassica oleracea]